MIFFAHDFGKEDPDSALISRTKFQKEHGRDKCAVGKEFGIAEG